MTGTYMGDELELFRHARVWKRYLAKTLRPYIRGDVLEVGAGLGGTTVVLCSGREASWTCLEPDAYLARKLDQVEAALPLRVVVGDLGALGPEEQFDTMLYIDVLEHIEDDRGEMERALARLRPGGHLVVLAPAHQSLFSAFDERVGHYRRYDRGSLRALPHAGAELVDCRYLDSVGVLASYGNRRVGTPMPSEDMIRLWDRVMVRASRLLDPLLRYRVGKSVIGVWRRTAP